MTAIFPGSFDPVTLGHLDLLKRAALVFDTIIVAILVNPAKKPLFTTKERVHMLQVETKDIPGVQIESFSGLLAEFAKKREVRYILRGIRSTSDATYEIPMAQANGKLLAGLETILFVTDPKFGYMSASLIREIASAAYNEDNGLDTFDDKLLDQWIPPMVKKMLKEKF